jgi:hypothetical protein
MVPLHNPVMLLIFCCCSRNGVYVLPDAEPMSEAAAVRAGAGIDAAASRNSIERSTNINRKFSGTRSSNAARTAAVSRASSISSSSSSSSASNTTAGPGSETTQFSMSPQDISSKEQTETKMMDDVLKLLGKHSAAAAKGNKQPFFIYHAPHAIHV